MRIHAGGAAAACLLAAILGLSRLEWAIVLLACALVITAELINTAVERIVDLAARAPHPLGKAAKDTAAGAVLAAAVFASVIGAIVYVPHLVHAARELLGK